MHVFVLILLVHCTISEEDNDEDVKMEDVDDDDDTTSISNVPDPYDMVYSKLPTNTHKLKSVEDCKR